MTQKHKRSPSGTSSRGFALVAVMGFVLLMTILVASVVSQSRQNLRTSTLALDAVTANAILEAGLQRAVLGLLAARPDDRWQADGQERTFTFHDHGLTVRIEDEAGKIDVNASAPQTLSRFFSMMGQSAEDASALADRIADWRDTDDLRHLNGAEASDYRMAGIGNGPANAPFHTTSEIRKVLDFPEGLFPCIAPYLTVYSGSAQILPQSAPARLKSLIEQDEATQQSVVSGRRRGTTAGGRTFRITVRLDTEEKLPFTRWTVLRLTEHPDDPVIVLDFGNGDPATLDKTCAEDLKTEPQEGQV